MNFQITDSAMITITTTSDMIVSWSIAYGKNFFPRSLTSSLYWRKTLWRSSTRSLGTIDLRGVTRRRAREAVARGRPLGGVLCEPVPAASFDQGGEVTPRRIDEVHVQRDQARSAPGSTSMWIA